MNFEYFYTKQSIGNIEIEDIGNCAIEAFNDDGLNFYLVVRTSMGTTNIFTFGPIWLDLEMFPANVNCTFKRIEFNEKKISREIQSFLNDPKSKITQAFEIDTDEALSKCRSIIEYMKNPELY